MRDPAASGLSGNDRLLLSVAEQLSRPFLQIARLTELLETSGDAGVAKEAWRTVRTLAESSLDLTESYALSLRLQGRVEPLELEPVTVSSMLYNAIEKLQPFAREHGATLDLDSGPRLLPVLGNREVIEAALVSLGQVFIASGSESDEAHPVRLASHASRYGTVAGLYGSYDMTAAGLRRARQLQGTARSPLPQLTSLPAAGVFVADNLLQAIDSKLHIARYRSLQGLAATLTPSRQMQLV